MNSGFPGAGLAIVCMRAAPALRLRLPGIVRPAGLRVYGQGVGPRGAIAGEGRITECRAGAMSRATLVARMHAGATDDRFSHDGPRSEETPMWTYSAPLRDMQFVIEDVLQAPRMARDARLRRPRRRDRAPGARRGGQVRGRGARADQRRRRISKAAPGKDGAVRTPAGYREAYAAYVEAAGPRLPCAPEDGGQGLPALLDAAFNEMIAAANHGWTMYPGLLHGAYECLRAPWQRGPEGALPRQDRQRRVAGDDVPDRAAGRQRPGPAAHAAPSRARTAASR